MKKDIEWLKNEVNEIKKLISDAWGAAIIAGNRHFETKNSSEMQIVKRISNLINQLDEPEVLSQEWIDKNKFEVNGWNEAVHVEDLQNLLVPKQEDMFNGEKPDEGEVYFAVGLGGAVEINSASSIDEAVERLTEHDTNYSVSKKPVIPKFVAEVIEEHKERGYDVYDSIDLIIETNGGGLPSISNWVARNIDKYARAWLDGYEVAEEQEPRYYAKIKGHENIASNDKYWNYNTDMEELSIGDSEVHPNVISEYTIKATKDEWANLGINDDNADFVKVEELEE